MKRKLLLPALLACLVSTAWADDVSKYQEESRTVAMSFMKQMGGTMQQAMSEGGPESAIKVCKDAAPKAASEISRQHGLKMTRVSLKVRNPLLGTADAWEQKVLQDFETRVAKGEKPDAMEAAEIVDEPAGKSFRYMKAIALQPGCVACHGNSEQIPDNVKIRLKEEYPHDKATGYSVGQIRGAISIKRPL